MKRAILPAVGLLAVLLFCTSPAKAAIHEFDFLLSATVHWSTGDSSGETGSGVYEVSDIPLSFSFNTDDSIGKLPHSRVDSYVIPSALAQLTIGGKPWTSYIPFSMNTQFFIEMFEGNLQTVNVEYESSDGNWYSGYSNELRFWLYGGSEPGTYGVDQLIMLASENDGGNNVSSQYINADCTLTPAPTPIPGAAWLLGSGLIGLVGLRRKFA